MREIFLAILLIVCMRLSWRLTSGYLKRLLGLAPWETRLDPPDYVKDHEA